jgi:hypothetical protein
VFDTAAKTSNGLYLNDILQTGPTCQKSLRIILMRFRTRKIGIKGDIKPLFTQKKVHKDDQELKRKIWRDNLISLAAYQMTGVTLESAPSSFVATRSLIF